MMSCWIVHLRHKNKKQQFMKIKAGRKIFLPAFLPLAINEEK